MKIPFHFDPRDYQIPILRGFSNPDLLYIIQVWTRRGGKDITDINGIITELAKEPAKATYVFPELGQGRKNLWENIENDGFRTIDHFPKDIIKRIDNQNLTIEFKNGSIFEMRGSKDSNDVQMLRGANSKYYVLSEFADQHPDVITTILPVVTANGGKIIINGTPKIDGRNGAAFKRMFDSYQNKPNALVSVRDAIGVMPQMALDELREASIEKWGNDFFYRQEYLLDWGQVSTGSYYGAKLDKIATRGQLGSFPYDSNLPVYTAWDIGVSDDTAIWFFQIKDKKPYFIDFFNSHDIGTEAYIEYIKSQPYRYATHFFPWDVAQRDKWDGDGLYSKIKDSGLVNSEILRRLSVDTGIDNVATMLSSAYFDTSNPSVVSAINTIKLYKRKFNEFTGEYMGAEHDSASHAADALRYAAQAIGLIVGTAQPQVQPKITQEDISARDIDPMRAMWNRDNKKSDSMFATAPNREWI